MSKSFDILKKITSKWYIYIIILLLSILCDFFALCGLMYGFSKLSLIIIVLCFLLLLFFVIFNIYYNRKNLASVFITLFIPLSLLYMTLIIPNHVPDELAHIIRVNDVSGGHIMTRRGIKSEPIMEAPYELIYSLSTVVNYNTLGNEIRHSTDYKNLVIVPETATGASGYSMFGYLSPAIVFKICSLFSLNIYITYYLCRLMNLLLASYLLYKAIKLIPFGKWVIFAITLNPMFVQQVSSLSADSLINSLSLFFIAYILKIDSEDRNIKNGEFILTLIIAIVLSSMKCVYFPLFILPLILFKKGNEKNNLKIITIILVSIISAFISYYISSLYVSENPYVIANNVDSIEQIKYIIKNPFSYILTIFRTLKNYGMFYLYTMFGRNLGILEIYVNEIAIILYFILFMISSFIDNEHREINILKKIVFVLSFITIFLLIETALYVGWTSVGGSEVIGVQGRYFLPIIALVPLSLMNNKIFIKKDSFKIVYVFLIILLNLYSLYKIMCYFM